MLNFSMFLLLPSIVCIETECRCVIWHYECESPLLRVMSCSEHDLIITVHSNGGIAWRAWSAVEDEKGNTALHYEPLLIAETQRQTAHHRIVAAALCPVTQITVALLYNSGSIALYQLSFEEDKRLVPYRARYITDIISVDENLRCSAKGSLK
ncbi:unnamed protein product [Gongylonema pulchrum]|uniref:Nucleoporin_N domain-containing protein n=1 Tax=Gongylonema pulchrum TaxID=637853 RepID=A0A183DHC8_9BILA|nr:unnamed protein product [Gongylonema pulchrum]